ncbi:MAG: phage tail protein [Methylococcaceae bacterium]|nr:phage tail protein [Methylococcaceae bacterium]
MNSNAERKITDDPFLSFRFKVTIDGIGVAGFNEVTGLTFETEIETFREGGFNACERQLLGPTKCPEKLVLKRGLSSNELWRWYRKVIAGQGHRTKQLTISLRDYSGEDVSDWQWVFNDVCPVKWTGPQFHAATAEVAFETIELIHKGLQP